MIRDDVSRKVLMLERLKKELLKNNLDEINLDEDISLHDKLIKEFCLGKLDYFYDSNVFDNMNIKEKSVILKEVHKYQNLCFYDNNPEYWTDSVDSISVDDYSLITYQIFDNFEFLVKLYVIGGEDSLKLLSGFSKSKYQNKELSAVENIRRNFVNDEVLIEIFKNMSNEKSLFDVFSENEKNILLEYPEGVLYFYNDNGVKLVDPLFLSLELYFRMNGKSYDIDKREDFIRLSSKLTGFFNNEDGFDDTVMDMYYEYQQKLGINSSIDNEKIIDGLNRSELRDKWILQDESLLMNDDIPYINDNLKLL